MPPSLQEGSGKQMVDCHMHMVLDGKDWRGAIARHKNGPDIAYIRGILARYQEEGYTYLRDGGDRWGVGKAARSLAEEYGMVYRTPLAPLCRQGHYGAFIGKTYNSLREYAALVRELRSEGADFVKLMLSGLMDFDRFGVVTDEPCSPQLLRELVHIAHEEGFAVMAHVNGARTVEAAARHGVDSVEHGAYLDEDALQAMVDCGTVWVPTVSTVANLRGRGRFDEEAVQAIFSHTAGNIRRFSQLGGLLAPGSDAGAWAVPHGCSTEYPLLSQLLGGETVLARGAQAIRERF